MRIFGLALIIAALFLPLMWFAPLMAKHDALAIFSQFLGTFALVGMAIGQMLAIRWAGLEPIFGGLDRIYVIHKWLGISALATMVLHDIIDADVQELGRETLLNDIAETVGEVSLTLVIRIPVAGVGMEKIEANGQHQVAIELFLLAVVFLRQE